MRLLATILIGLAALATTPVSAIAEGWQVLYLADSGGSRPMQVGPNEGGIAFAYVDSGGGERLFLDCRTNDSGFYDWTLKFNPGENPAFRPVDADGTRLFARFDEDPAQIDLGLFSFVQGAYWAPVPADIALRVIRQEVIRITDGGSAVVEFSLAGSSDAIDRACPTP
jgi:hypothetical protein